MRSIERCCAKLKQKPRQWAYWEGLLKFYKNKEGVFLSWRVLLPVLDLNRPSGVPYNSVTRPLLQPRLPAGPDWQPRRRGQAKQELLGER